MMNYGGVPDIPEWKIENTLTSGPLLVKVGEYWINPAFIVTVEPRMDTFREEPHGARVVTAHGAILYENHTPDEIAEIVRKAYELP